MIIISKKQLQKYINKEELKKYYDYHSIDEIDIVKACQNSNYKIVKDLIKHEISIPDNILWHCKSIKIFSLLIKKRIDINYLNYSNETVLFHLLKNYLLNNFKLVKYLIKNGININHKNDIYKPAIFYACHANNIKIVKYLIKHGAELKYTHTTLFDSFLYYKYYDILELLLKLRVYNNLKHYIIDEKIMKLLIQYDIHDRFTFRDDCKTYLLIERCNDITNNFTFNEINLNKIVLQYIH